MAAIQTPCEGSIAQEQYPERQKPLSSPLEHDLLMQSLSVEHFELDVLEEEPVVEPLVVLQAGLFPQTLPQTLLKQHQ